MNTKKLLHRALRLSIVTVVYNIFEGVISIYYGFQEETLALFGFGIDSFIEVLSAAGIFHMIQRMKKIESTDIGSRDKFEKQALSITGFSFYLLAIGLIAGSIINVFSMSAPDTTVPGVVIALVSITTMYSLMKFKLKVGKELNSSAIIADAHCTKTCFYLSFVLLIASGLYEIFGLLWFDVLGSLGVAWFAYAEGRESMEKARSGKVACCCTNKEV